VRAPETRGEHTGGRGKGKASTGREELQREKVRAIPPATGERSILRCDDGSLQCEGLLIPLGGACKTIS
jgi:hypothetical protein